MDHFLVPHHYHETIDSILIPHGVIMDRVEKLAADIRKIMGIKPYILSVY